VVLEFRAENGRRVTEYTFSSDKLIVQIAIKGPKLPEPMQWTFTYRRP
jgi:hypothetical protein